MSVEMESMESITRRGERAIPHIWNSIRHSAAFLAATTQWIFLRARKGEVSKGLLKYHGKDTAVATIEADKVKLLAKQAKTQGIEFSVVKEKGQESGTVDIWFDYQDAVKMQRCMEKSGVGVAPEAKIEKEKPVLSGRLEKARMAAEKENARRVAEARKASKDMGYPVPLP